ncbi:hypothetical protein M405DRAFT_58916 [Rhizopogon salebrosus TDB-379]|nr:hypothetical protein M405DRAFT_58916 [Rhizopogon salebrosus TDB-379]
MNSAEIPVSLYGISNLPPRPSRSLNSATPKSACQRRRSSYKQTCPSVRHATACPSRISFSTFLPPTIYASPLSWRISLVAAALRSSYSHNHNHQHRRSAVSRHPQSISPHQIACCGGGIITVWDAQRLPHPLPAFTEKDAAVDGARTLRAGVLLLLSTISNFQAQEGACSPHTREFIRPILGCPTSTREQFYRRGEFGFGEYRAAVRSWAPGSIFRSSTASLSAQWPPHLILDIVRRGHHNESPSQDSTFPPQAQTRMFIPNS